MDRPIQIPGYKIEKHIGSGAMAAVYLAIQQSLERKVALKLMASSMLGDPVFRERFLKEGKIIAQLNHRNIVTIYDIGLVESSYYMAMEYVDGGNTLKELIPQRLSAERAVDILRQMASALGFAHQHGFIHRDVKPANILMRKDGTPVLSDFGIAKTFDGTQMTAVGSTMGTPSYMSTEQIRGLEVDARSDLYSLGVVFFEMLTGAKPYQADSIPAVLWMHINDPIPRLPAKLAKYQTIVDHLMAKEPDERYSNAEALIAALAKINARNVLEPTPEDAATWVVDSPQDDLSQPPYVKPDGEQTQPTFNTADTRLTPSVAGKRWMPFWLFGLAGVILIAGATVYVSWDRIISITINTIDSSEPPLPPRPALDERVRKEVEGLLRTAEGHRENDFLSDYEMPVSNATTTYKRVLEYDPSNPEALAGLQEIADIYETRARESLAKKDFATASALVQAGLSAVEDHPGLLSLQAELQSAAK